MNEWLMDDGRMDGVITRVEDHQASSLMSSLYAKSCDSVTSSSALAVIGRCVWHTFTCHWAFSAPVNLLRFCALIGCCRSCDCGGSLCCAADKNIWEQKQSVPDVFLSSFIFNFLNQFQSSLSFSGFKYILSVYSD